MAATWTSSMEETTSHHGPPPVLMPASRNSILWDELHAHWIRFSDDSHAPRLPELAGYPRCLALDIFVCPLMVVRPVHGIGAHLPVSMYRGGRALYGWGGQGREGIDIGSRATHRLNPDVEVVRPCTMRFRFLNGRAWIGPPPSRHLVLVPGAACGCPCRHDGIGS